jgi:hypothetical protein
MIREQFWRGNADGSDNLGENAPGVDGRSEGVARAKDGHPRRRTFPTGASAVWRS